MTYDARQMSILAYNNGFTMWHYRTDDKFEEVIREGYFDNARTLVSDGDIVICTVDIGNEFRTFIGALRKRGKSVGLTPIAGKGVR